MVIANYLVNGAVPSTVGGVGTTTKYFADLPAMPGWLSSNPNVNTVITSNGQGFTPSSTTNLGGLLVPGRSVLNGQRFNAVASGNIYPGTTEASGTLTVGMYLSNVAASASPNYQTLIELTQTNPTVDAIYYAWTLSVGLQGDTQSGILQIVKSGAINGTQTTAAQVTALTGISFATEPAFTLVVGVTFGTSAADNAANLFQFGIELL